MSDLQMGFLSRLTEIHFGKTGPTGGAVVPYKVDLTILLGEEGETFEQEDDNYWITLATYGPGAQIGISEPITLSSVSWLHLGDIGPSGVNELPVSLSNITKPLFLLFYAQSPFAQLPPEAWNGFFTATELAGKKRTCTAPVSQIGTIGGLPIGDTHEFSLQIAGIGLNFESGVGNLGSAGPTVGVNGVIA